MTTESNKTRKPTHIAYHVRQAGEQTYWDRIGVAWRHRDGKGFNIDLGCVPIDGKITLRVPNEQATG